MYQPPQELLCKVKQMTPLLKKIVVVLWLATAAFTGLAGVGTTFYFLAEMPRSPDPETRRVYPVAAGNQRVYVNRTELEWEDFLRYDLGTLTGCGVVTLGVVLLIRVHKGQPPIKRIQDLWS
jgi:hypothetical protein